MNTQIKRRLYYFGGLALAIIVMSPFVGKPALVMLFTLFILLAFYLIIAYFLGLL
jgi:uncharacterized membrane protein